MWQFITVSFGKARDYVLGVTVMIKLLGIFPREILKDNSTNMALHSIPTSEWETGSPRGDTCSSRFTIAVFAISEF